MAGHVCRSISVVCGSSARSWPKSRREPQFGPGNRCLGTPDRAPRGSATSPEVGRGRCLEAYVFENWVSEIVQMVAWKDGAGKPTPSGALGGRVPEGPGTRPGFLAFNGRKT